MIQRDVIKVHTILHDLLIHSWPVVYDSGNSFVYSIAWYLPAAGVGKLFGGGAVWPMLSLWTVIGVALGAGWFLYHCGGKWWALAIFVFGSGLDLMSIVI